MKLMHNTHRQWLQPLVSAAMLVLALVLSLASSPAQAMTALEIIEQSNLAAVYPGNDGRAEARMMIVDKQGRKQIRQFVILRRNVEKGGDQQYLVSFTRPADVARTTFLVNKHPGKDDDRWLYLPGLDLVKRIAAGDKRTSFVGSTFFYEDISGRDIAADDYRISAETDSHWLLEATPKSTKGVEFSRFTVKVNKQNYLPEVAEYYDGQDKLYRRISAVKIRVINDIPTIVQMKAEDLRNGGYTINQMRNVRYDEGIPEAIFTERSLRRPPRQWMQFK